ncbi:type II toxin-antitoxin system Phd/YefM family antitoxin [Kribbia dieselivorans]|uniref:type II toxin-antitoxin system Phd/YefM family antitoxin n=1 Tax=Kribbia dieselivorans TaxID=331526 RepID=UPI0008380BE1|nr:type II toxin-antitoxin system prevent-host-death family antitoxin [Kribbia dieselivorans]
MRTVTKRELNQRTAAVLDQVTDTDDIVVTERGQPRWRVSRVRESESALTRLEREGRYEPPAVEPEPWPTNTVGRAYTDEEIDALLEENRGDH